jgi:2-desacetyl-2-hydroxyethyl bacteriochlorophyllide A dehydrogenase
MKAVVVTGPATLEVLDVADPVPGPHDVLIRVAAAGICGTDLHILAGGYTSLPVIPGHEFAGTVQAVGDAVDSVLPGDVVAADPNVACRRCRYCRGGRENLCPGLEAIGVTLPGAAAEMVLVSEEKCVKLPNLVNPADGALVEPLSCVVHAFDLLPRPLAQRYLIYGAGTMGLLASTVAKLAGATTVDLIDVNRARLQRAERFAVTSAVTDVVELAAPEHGWDIVIDCTGAVPAIEAGIQRVAPGGTFLHFGVAREGAKVSYDPNHVLLNEITIVGSKSLHASFERAALLLDQGSVRSEDFITHRLGLEDYETGVELVRKGEGLKVQVLPNL